MTDMFPHGGLGWAYLVYLPALFGTVAHPASFYAGHYKRAFPVALVGFTDVAHTSPAEQLASRYKVRTFKRG